MKCLTGPAEWHNITAAMKRKLVLVGLLIPDPTNLSVTSAHHFWSTWMISAGSDIRAGNGAFLCFIASVQVDVLLTDLENLGGAGLAKNSHTASAHSGLTPCMISHILQSLQRSWFTFHDNLNFQTMTVPLVGNPWSRWSSNTWSSNPTSFSSLWVTQRKCDWSDLIQPPNPYIVCVNVCECVCTFSIGDCYIYEVLPHLCYSCCYILLHITHSAKLSHVRVNRA